MNIFTDLTLAATKGFQTGIADGLNYLNARNCQKDEIKQTIMRYLRLFGSENRA